MQPDFNRIEAELKALLGSLAADFSKPPQLAKGQSKRLLQQIRRAIPQLQELGYVIDLVRQPPLIFDPYQPSVLGRFIGVTMQEQPRHPLGMVQPFYGSGVYALYYRGDFPAYSPIRGKNTPIYAGKADPSTPNAPTPEQQGQRLATRLRDHAKSIRAVTNHSISVEDFDCRFLVITSGLQEAAEDFLLNYFLPIWNQPICKGFGKHGDSPDTRKNTRSEWDTLHPGRKWATKIGNVNNPKPIQEIMKNIQAHFGKYPPKE